MSRSVVDGARDLDELAELVAVAVQPFAAALGARLDLHQLEGAVHRDEQLVGARFVGERARRAPC